MGWALTFLLALAIRLAHVLAIRDTPIADLLLIDSETYDRFARLILAGRFRGEDVYSMNLLYPYFLASIYAVLGAAPWKALVVQAVLSAIHAALIFELARRFFDRPTAWVAGLVAALYAPYVFYAGALLTPTLIDLCVVASLLALSMGLTGGRPAWMLASGVLTGLSALGRGSALLFVGLVLPALKLARRTWSGALRAWAIFTIGALGVVGAVVLRNTIVEGAFVPLAANYAALYLGHHDGANGLYAMHGFDAGAGFEDEVTGVRRQLSRQMGRELTQAEASAELFRRGLTWAGSHPVEELRLAAAKTCFFWNRTESPTNLGIDFAREFSGVLRALPIHFGIVAPLGLAGLVLTRRRWRELMPLYAAVAVPWITCVAFFMSAEYRLPAAMVMIVFGAHAAVRVSAFVFKARRRVAGSAPVLRDGIVALALLPVFATACNFRSSLLVSQTKNRVSFYNYGVLYERRGALDRAEAMLRRSLAVDPRFTPALVALAGVENRQGRATEAARHLDEARAVDPGAAPVSHEDRPRVEAEALYQAGRFEEARVAFEMAATHYLAKERPDEARAMRNNLGLTLHRLHRDTEAETMLRSIVAESPGYARAHSNLALVLEARGRASEAIAEYRRTLELDPANARARRSLERLGGR